MSWWWKVFGPIGVLIGVLFAAWSKGKTDAKSELQRDELEAVKTRKEVDDAVAADGDVGPDLSRWMRDNPKR